MSPRMRRRTGAIRRALRPVSRWKRWLAAAGRRIVGLHRVHGAVPGHADAQYCLAIPDLAGPYWPVGDRITLSGWAIDLATGRPLDMRVSLGGRPVTLEREDRPDLVAAFRRIAPLPPDAGVRMETRVRFGASLLRVDIVGPELGRVTIFRCIVLGFGRWRGTARLTGPWRYRDWQERDLDETGEAGPAQAGFTLVVLNGDPAALDATLASIEAQTHAARETILVSQDTPESGRRTQAQAHAHAHAHDFAAALDRAAGDFVIPLRAGDVLDRRALHHLASAARAGPQPDLIYADEEIGADAGRASPVFKPDWSPDTLEAHHYLGAPAAFRSTLARGLPARDPYDLALRVTERTARVRHLPKILCRRPAPTPLLDDIAIGRDALSGRLERTGRAGRAEVIEEGLACYATAVAPPDHAPLVSIVIPTAGRAYDFPHGRASLVLTCIEGIRRRSTYGRVEIVVVTNVDLEAGTVAALQAHACRLVRCRRPGFNFSTMVNLGVAEAEGEYVVLLNDDTDVIAPDWIEALLGQAAKPHVGVVGGQLLYPDGTIQHAGLVTLRGIPFHVRLGFPGADLGYQFSSAAARNVSAVTGACLMARKAVYARLGGFPEEFPSSYNDVDFCFRVRQAGLTAVYEPRCRLYHFESASRDAKVDPTETARLLARWPDQAARDPYYNGIAFSTAPPAFEPCIRMPARSS